jgi:hypothetical protein
MGFVIHVLDSIVASRMLLDIFSSLFRYGGCSVTGGCVLSSTSSYIYCQMNW